MPVVYYIQMKKLKISDRKIEARRREITRRKQCKPEGSKFRLLFRKILDDNDIEHEYCKLFCNRKGTRFAIVDFYFPESNTVVEINPHFRDDQVAYLDTLVDQIIEIANNDVLNEDLICDFVLDKLG